MKLETVFQFLECERIAKQAMIIIPQLQARIKELESKQRLLPASEETRAQLMMRLADIADKTNDHRALVTAQAAMISLY